MPRDAVLAFDGGEFNGTMPWGWYVHDGIEIQPPGNGPLSMAIVIDSTNALTLRTPGEFATLRGHVRDVLQSYPTLLIDSMPPAALLPGSTAIDLAHRDSRLAIGTARNGDIILAITRVGGSRGAVGMLPLGPTIPELAAIMQRLGAIRAVGLDGGLSSQLAVRDARGVTVRWKNWRRVPVGVVGRRAVCA